MKKRKLISALLSLSMLASAFSMTAAVHAEETTETPAFSDDFSSYTTENVEHYNTDTSYVFADGQKVLATAPDGSKWISSNVYQNKSGGAACQAYFDVENHTLMVRGGGGAMGPVNLSTASPLGEITKAEFTVRNGARGAGANLFVSKDEKSFIMFGFHNSDVINDYYGSIANDRMPFIAIRIGSSITKIDAQNVSGAQTKDGETIKWTVTVDRANQKIDYTAEGTTVTANGSIPFVDTEKGYDLTKVLDFYEYPLAAISFGEGFATVDDIKLYGEKPTFGDTFTNYKTAVTDPASHEIGNAITIVEHETGEKWKTSGVQNGFRSNHNGVSKANLSTDKGKLRVLGYGNIWMAAVNLDLGRKTESISRLKFKTDIGTRGGGALLFKNSSESNYLMLGQQRYYESTNQMAGVTSDAEKNRPVINYRYNRTGQVQSIKDSDHLAIGGLDDGWTKNDTSILWDVIVNEDNTLYITAKGNASGYSTFTIDNENVKKLLEDVKYPLAVFSNDGSGGSESYIDNVSIWYTPYEEPTVGADFTSLGAAQPVKAGTITYDYGSKQLLTADAATGVKWYTSEVYCGQGDKKVYSTATEGGDPIYESLSGSATANSNGLTLKSRYQADVAANMDYKFKDVSKITAVTGVPSHQIGVRFLINENEKSYYEIRLGRSNDNQNADKAGSSLTYGSPRFTKVENGEVTAKAYCSEVWGLTNSDYTWNIEFEGNNINMKVVSGAKSWTYTYTDTGLSNMMSASKYPVSFVVKGDGGVVFRNAAIWGTPVYDAVKDNGDGTVTATIQDGIYENTDTINEVVAFYNAAGDMIDSQVLTSDGNTLVQDTFDKGEAETVKAFVFDGDPKNGVLLNAVSYEDEVSEVSADPIKVACVGDSLTEGNGASDGNEYPAQLQRMLGRGYEVKNFGVGSRTVCASGNDKDGAALKYTEYVGYYKGQRLWEPTYTYSIYENGVWVPQWTSTHPKTSVYEDSKSFNPDIVVIQLGTNDAAKLDLSQEALQEEFTDVYAGMIEEYKKTAKEIYVVVPPLYGKEASGSVNQKIVNYIKPILEGFVKDYGVKMINMQYGPTASQQTDGIHYTNAGYKVMAKTVYDAIKDKIEYSYDGSEISVKPAASVYGNIVAAAYDNSGLSGLEMIGNGKEILPPNVATVIDTSSIATGAAAIKVMAWDSFNSMKPVAKVGEKTAAGYSVSNGVTTVTGKTAPNSSVVITAYDADENLVYVNNVLTDYDSDYSFSFAGDSASVYVNGTAVDVK